mgnify:CR=1 FL=1
MWTPPLAPRPWGGSPVVIHLHVPDVDATFAAMGHWWARPPFRLHYVTAREAFKLGAKGFVLKQSSADELVKAMGTRRFVEPRITGGFSHGPLVTLRSGERRGRAVVWEKSFGADGSSPALLKITNSGMAMTIVPVEPPATLLISAAASSSWRRASDATSRLSVRAAASTSSLSAKPKKPRSSWAQARWAAARAS